MQLKPWLIRSPKKAPLFDGVVRGEVLVHYSALHFCLCRRVDCQEESGGHRGFPQHKWMRVALPG